MASGFSKSDDLTSADLGWLEEYYLTKIRPVLTPLAIDPAHPFPQLLNKSLNLMVRLEMAPREGNGHPLKHLAVVQCPRILPRLIQLPRDDARRDYVFLSHLIGHFIADLFPGTTILGCWPFRVTRNSELYIDEEDTSNLLKAVETELHNRRKGDAVRLEIDHDCPEKIREALLKTFRLTEDDLYLVNGPLNPDAADDAVPGRPLAGIARPAVRGARRARRCAARGFVRRHPRTRRAAASSLRKFQQRRGISGTRGAGQGRVRHQDTLYRTGGDPRIVGALMNAVNNGKQVTAVVELRARFDEANNIQWTRQLEENGVHVVYGLVGLKIHAKVALVVRSEGGQIRRYVHLATGNYNPTTARLYTDISLLTCQPEFGEDATNLFNLLTGICQFQGMKKLIVAPFDLHARLLQLIERETDHARRGLPARIIAQMNSLVEPAAHRGVLPRVAGRA